MADLKPIVQKNAYEAEVLFLKTVYFSQDEAKGNFCNYPNKATNTKDNLCIITEKDLSSFSSALMVHQEDVMVRTMIGGTPVNFSFRIGEEYDPHYGCGSNIRYVIVICIVYDISNRESFQNVPDFEEIIRNRTKKRIIIVGQHPSTSPSPERKVSLEEGRQLAQLLGHPFIEVSSFTGFHMSQLFELVLYELLDPTCPVSCYSNDTSKLLATIYGFSESEDSLAAIVYPRARNSLRVYFSKWNSIGWLICLRSLYEEKRLEIIEGQSDPLVSKILSFHKDLFGAFLKNYFFILVHHQNDDFE